jgi:uncharacterized protein YacL
MNNIVKSSYNAINTIEKDIKNQKWMDIIIDIISLIIPILVSAFIGRTLWNYSVPKLFPMIGKAREYDVLVLHVLLKILFN